MGDNIQTKDRADANLDIASKVIGDVQFPRNILTDPDGNDITPAQQATLALLLTAAQAIQAAAEGLNTKTTAVNTGAVAGSVAVSNFEALSGLPVSGDFYPATQPVSGTFWQATQPVSFTWAGLTDTQLRATPVAVSADALPLPAGAATEATLSTLAGAVKAEDSASADGDPGIVLLAQRRDSDTTAVSADGDYATLKLDEAGRLKVATQPASYAATTGNIGANGQTVAVNCERFSNLMIHCKGTFSTVNVTFEGSLDSTNGTDGTWFTVQAIRSNANTIETATGNLSAAPAYAWELSVNGLKWFRVRATAYTSGTQTWTMVPGTYATEPIPGAQISGTQPVSGTVSMGAATARAGFVAQAGIWYDDTSAALGSNATFTGTSRDATVTATATAMANAATYAQEIRVSAEADVSGTLWLEVSRDNTNWRRAKSVPTAAVTGGGQYAEIVHRPSWRYWRAGFTNGATAQARLAVGSIAMA